MSADDPFLAAALDSFDDSVKNLRASIEGASPEALNWRPGGNDTNSIAVLAVHSLASTRSWLSAAVGAPLPERDRPSEFRASAEDAARLIEFAESLAADCRKLIDNAGDVDWSAIRRSHTRAVAGASEDVIAAWALIHAMQHLREHVGQTLLTRQLWDSHAHD